MKYIVMMCFIFLPVFAQANDYTAMSKQVIACEDVRTVFKLSPACRSNNARVNCLKEFQTVGCILSPPNAEAEIISNRFYRFHINGVDYFAFIRNPSALDND